MRNDSIYREGRQLLSAEDGRPQAVKPSDDRVLRAVGKKSAFGIQVQHTSWLMYEFSALQILHEAGVPVPKPYAVSENAILMEYIGDERMPAPTLHEVRLARDEAEPLFERTRQSIEAMLQKGFVHGDLSAFNVLYWQGEIKLIDFPQVVDTQANNSAQAVLGRDVKRICQYFSRYGIRVSPGRLAAEMWGRYAAQHPDDLAADFSRKEYGIGADAGRGRGRGRKVDTFGRAAVAGCRRHHGRRRISVRMARHSSAARVSAPARIDSVP